ncbi:hypothetical protein MXB_2532 [Myxobolus squamalis]|nr:hypothetical protein MXB_2532 [Myxobolus squamalis]
MSTYKFFIAAENSHCPEYTTEKYWGALASGAIPIVIGYPKNQSYLIPGSYIDAFKFRHPRDLADYLKTVMNSVELFSKYHTWKSRYALTDNNFDTCKILEKITFLLDQGDVEDPNIHKINDESICIDQYDAYNLLVK